MFGLIISGRPVDASPQAVTEAQFAFKVSPSPTFNHIVVFLLPGTQLPPGTAATVYVQIPPSQEFKLLGAIGPGKESAIFKISGLKSGAADPDGDVMVDDISSSTTNPSPLTIGDIVVGVSIEPVSSVEAQLATLKATQTNPSSSSSSSALARTAAPSSTEDARVTTKVLAQRIIGNAFNFLASFGSDTVPLKAFQDWWTKFEKKVELDPSFLERES
jgi:hypothetical protein